MASMMDAVFPDGEGSVELIKVPKPLPQEGRVLVQTTRSLISAGTETGMIKTATGWTREEILDKNFRLGYSATGVVIESGISDLCPGDRVACYGGPFVSHSEYLSVPSRLVHLIPENLSEEEALFMGLGAIGLHGFRMGKASLGEIAAVAGAGILGNLLAQFALCAGCRVIVSDLSPDRLACLERCVGKDKDLLTVSASDLDFAVDTESGNQGADAVYLAVSTKSSEPMHQAIRIVRAGGNIVIVGVLDIQIPREMFFYREANVTISRAAGPGRYDPNYEDQNVDYPIQYVRWTEGRNLREVLRLLGRGVINVKPLIADRFPVSKVCDAYQAVQSGKLEGAAILDW